jgi:hypothetical protein
MNGGSGANSLGGSVTIESGVGTATDSGAAEPPTKRRRRGKRLYNPIVAEPPTKRRRRGKRVNATKHKSNLRNLNTPEEKAEIETLEDELKNSDSMLRRAVLLQMTLEKNMEEMEESPNSMDLPSPHGLTVENRGMIGEGFRWKDFPYLENVLRESMSDYYEMRLVLGCVYFVTMTTFVA